MNDEMQTYFNKLKRCLLSGHGKIPTDAAAINAALLSDHDPEIFMHDMGHLVAMLGDSDVLEFDAAMVDLVRAHPELVEHAKEVVRDATSRLKAEEPS